MSENIHNVIALFNEIEGIDLIRYNKSFLNKSIQKRISDNNSISFDEYCGILKNNSNERKILIESLRVSFSEFFRNSLTCAVLERLLLPLLVLKKKKQKEIRIWSAACAGGQEAYSLAILMEELIEANQNDISYRIFATDHSEEQIQKAQQGQFPIASLKKSTLKRTEDWFTKQGDMYMVKSELKEKIDFSIFDLFNEKLSCPQVSIFGDFDLIVCANLLFYYEPEYQKRIIEKASNCLAMEGYFITDESERDIVNKYYFREIYPQSAIFQKEE
jgi:chemotaxis methyl-accepting protein methylase